MFFETERDKQLYFSERDNVCPPHFHKSVEIMYVLSGRKIVYINGKSMELTQGDVLVCPPYTVHRFPPCENTLQLVATATTEYCERFEAFCRTNQPRSYVIKDNNDELLTLIRELQRPQNEIALIGAVNRLLGKYLAKTEFFPIKDTGERTQIAQIAEYIEHNYHEEITLASIAEKFGYSRNYFSALFKKYFQTGLTQYVNFIRIQKSLPLLRQQKTSSIYFRVGFNSPQQYFLNFKKYYGCSPKEYLLLQK